MSNSPKWISAKATGDEAELELCGILTSWGGVAGVRSIGKAPAADLAVMLQLEVKADGMAAGTGNIALEVESRGHPSGLQTTRAALWAIRAGAEWFLVPVPVLKRLVAGAPVVGAAEANRVALVPVSALRPVALVISRGAAR